MRRSRIGIAATAVLLLGVYALFRFDLLNTNDRQNVSAKSEGLITRYKKDHPRAC